MPKLKKWSEKTLTGVYHWSQCQDWRLYKYESIWDLPISYLEEHGWYQIETHPLVEIPIQKLEIDKNYSSKGGFNYRSYQLLQIDWEYLLERQARFYASLHWGQEEIAQFHQTSEKWLIERTTYNRERELHERAEELSKQFGMTVEDVMKIITAKSDVKPEPPKPVLLKNGKPVPEGRLYGDLEKLSNEFFILVEGKDRYKLHSKNDLKESGEPKGANPDRFIGMQYTFSPNTDFPPKSRNAKGWAENIERVIN